MYICIYKWAGPELHDSRSSACWQFLATWWKFVYVCIEWFGKSFFSSTTKTLLTKIACRIRTHKELGLHNFFVGRVEIVFEKFHFWNHRSFSFFLIFGARFVFFNYFWTINQAFFFVRKWTTYGWIRSKIYKSNEKEVQVSFGYLILSKVAMVGHIFMNKNST